MSWATGFLGILLMISPYVLGYNNNAVALWVNLAIGFLVFSASVIEWLRENREDWEYWAICLFGIAAIIAPFALSFTGDTLAMWGSIGLGIVTGLTAIVKIVIDEPKHVPFIHE